MNAINKLATQKNAKRRKDRRHPKPPDLGLVRLPTLRIPLLATSPYAAEAIDRVVLPWPCAWVLGHEGAGLSAAVQERCAMSLRIAQPGGEESLNVAAAAAVCFYEASRQRAAAGRLGDR